MSSQVSETAGSEGQLLGMPAPLELCLERSGDGVAVSYGGRLLSWYEAGDRGMRNLAIVSLTQAGIPGVQVARLFGVRPERVSALRRAAAEGGSAGLLAPLGRPVTLDRAQVKRAYEMADRGVTGVAIARTLGTSEATISRLLARRAPGGSPRVGVQGTIPVEADSGMGGADGSPAPAAGSDRPVIAADAKVTADTEVAAGGGVGEIDVVEDAGGESLGGAPRIEQGGGRSAYAGAMLLYPFLEKVGAGEVFGALDSGPGRRYDSTVLVLECVMAFALGSSSLEGSKHLLPVDAGLLVGAWRFPHLRTLRPRLAALADRSDPLAVQVALAKAMLAGDLYPPGVFFVDDHFVAYTGSRPVAKGWNTRRRHAEKGRDDTVIVDDLWRGVCFASGPPAGLAGSMLGPLDQLREIVGERRVMIGFDRGGAYPAAFAEIRERGMDWVTYRRAPLPEPTVEPRTSWVVYDGRRHCVKVADETVQLTGYGPARQISLFQDGRMVLQILTSDTTTCAARLAHVLRGRWCIENTFKYMEDHLGLHWLCDYRMDIAPDETLVKNPARASAREALKASQTRQAEIQQAVGTHLATATPTPQLKALQAIAQDVLQDAQESVNAQAAALKPIPAKVPATTIDPDAKRATPRTGRRALQTVCRLLAYNAELDLARALNNYLNDPDEYRALTRNLLHQPGEIQYTPTSITVTLTAPHAPRIARALTLLLDQINTTPPRLAGDHRRITYRLATP